jgi:hypothetical protein
MSFGDDPAKVTWFEDEMQCLAETARQLGLPVAVHMRSMVSRPVPGPSTTLVARAAGVPPLIAGLVGFVGPQRQGTHEISVTSARAEWRGIAHAGWRHPE